MKGGTQWNGSIRPHKCGTFSLAFLIMLIAAEIERRLVRIAKGVLRLLKKAEPQLFAGIEEI
jgi:hypothetical protein